MQSSDFDRSGTLRNRKRFRLGGKKRNSDGESRTYIESPSASESEYHSDEKKWINWTEWLKTLEQVKALGTRSKTATESRSSTSTETRKGNIVNPTISSETT